MIRPLFLLIGLFFALNVHSQTATLFSDDFESGMNAWTAADDLLPNYWIDTTCAGNGTSAAGSHAMYITPGGINPGCGASGDIQYAYVNSGGGSLIATNYAAVDATCATTLGLSFDYRIEGVSTEDFGEAVYSTDGGSSWISLTGELPISAAWTTMSIALPGALGGTNFLLGFRFHYNDVTVTGVPLAIDNVIVGGLDSTPPLMTCPSSIDQPTDSNCDAFADDYTKDVLTLSDNCTDSVFIVLTQNPPEFTQFFSGVGGTESVTITAYDEAGNSTQCTVTINIVDQEWPTVICPPDTNVYVDQNCDGTLENYIGDIVTTDNCSPYANLIISQSPPSGTVINGSIVQTTMTMTVTDESGNTNSCNFIARTIDTLVAQITCPGTMTVYADSLCVGSLPDYVPLTTATDNCIPSSSLTITQSPVSGTSINTDQIVTMTVSGAIPNIDQSCTFNVLFVDTISPSIVCPIATNIYLDGSCQATMSDYTSSAIVWDNCSSPVVTQNPAPGSTINGAGNITVTLTATDGAGNLDSCQLIQNILDTISPTIVCPGNQTENGDINCQAILSDYTSLATYSDNCSGVINVVQVPAAGTVISSPTAVTITATDVSGNSAQCSFNVTILDVIAPTVTCPGAQTASVDANCEYSLQDFTTMASSTDNCSAAINITYSQSPAPGTILNTGTYSITITATDPAGNSSNCSFDVDVNDMTNPVINCPSNQTVYADASCSGTIGDYTTMATATDNCSASNNITISQSPVAGTSISADTQITLTAIDEAGNSAICTFFAILTDTISPVVICPADQTLTINSSCQYTVPDLTGSVSGTDNCSVLANMTINQNPAAGATQGGITSVLITLIDEQGNSNTCVTTLIPDDQDPPIINCPSPAPVNNGSLCDFTLLDYSSMSSVLDNCPNYAISQSPPAGTVVSVGNTDITLTVTDAGGNTDQCTFTLNVFETELPIITCPGNISTCNPVVNYSLPSYSDNCEVSLLQTDGTGLSSGMTFPIGITTLEYTAVDSSGNIATCTFDVEILEYPSPANIQEDTIYLCGQNSTIVNADPITSGSGLWTLDAGQGTFNNQFTNSTGVNGIAIGTNVYIWTVSTASCGTLSDTLVVINTQQDVQASTQDTLYACNDPLVILQSNTPLYGTGTWSTSANANISDVNSSNTTATLITSGWQDFVWTIDNFGCPSTSDTLHVLANLNPYIFTSDTSLCLESSTLTIIGSSPSAGQTTAWSVGTGEAAITYADSSVAVISSIGFGNNWIIYSAMSEGCPTVSDTLLIIGTLCDGYDPILPTVITPNFDGKNDLFEIAYLEQLYPECVVTIFNRWGSVVFESVGYEDAWDGTYKGEPLPMGTYFYRVELNDEDNTILQGDISIIR